MSKKGEIRFNSDSGVKELPVFDTSDVNNSMVRVETGSGVGALSFVDPSKADLDEIRVNTESYGVLAASSRVFQTTTSLNGENAELVVLEDTDNDGKVENEETFTLSGGLEFHYPSNLDLSAGNHFWFYIQFENSDVTDAAELSDVTFLTKNGENQWTNRSTYFGSQSSAGATTDRLNDLASHKVNHGYAYEHPGITRGLVGWWPLTYTSGDAVDLSTNDNSGTVNNSPTRGVAGRGGLQAYSFDGTDDWIDPGTFSNFSQFTISFWSYHDDVSDSEQEKLIRLSENNQIKLEEPGDGTFVFGIYDGSSWTDISASVSNNVWTYWTATWDGSNMELFKNGSSQGTETESTNYSSSNNGDAIARAGSFDQEYFSGNLCDVRIYNRVLSSAEISTLYNWGNKDIATPPGSEDSSAVARWTLDEDPTSTSTATDSWGSNDGSINGDPTNDSNAVRNSGISFDGSGDDIVIGSSPLITGSQNRTLAMWINRDSSQADSNPTIFSMGGDGNNGHRWDIRLDSGNLRVEVEGDGYTTSFSPTSGVYEFLAVVLDGSTIGDHKIYFNSRTENSTGSQSLDTQGSNGTHIANVANSSRLGDRYFTGQIDEVRLYTRALKPREVRQLYLWGTRGVDMHRITPVR